MKIQAIYSYSGNTFAQKTNNVSFKSGVDSCDEQSTQIISRDGAEAIKAAALTSDNLTRFKMLEEAVKHIEEYEQYKADAAELYQKDCETVADIINLAQRASKNKFRDVRNSHGNVVKHFDTVPYKGNKLPRRIVEKDIPGLDKRVSFFDKGKLQRVEEYTQGKTNTIYVKNQRPTERLDGVVFDPRASLVTSDRKIRYSQPSYNPSGSVKFDYLIGVQNYKKSGMKIAKAYSSDDNGRLYNYKEGFFDDQENECVKIDREFEYQFGRPKSYFEGKFVDWGYTSTKKQIDFKSNSSYVKVEDGRLIPVAGFVE